MVLASQVLVSMYFAGAAFAAVLTVLWNQLVDEIPEDDFKVGFGHGIIIALLWPVFLWWMLGGDDE